MSFCWLCFGGFLLVMEIRFVGLVVLDGVVVGLAVGYGCYRQCGHGCWLCCWAFFFCLGC